MFEEAWAVIIASDGKRFVGYSSGLVLPSVVTDRMNIGQRHNEIMADFDKLLNLPNDNRDTWSRYTGGTISRRVSLAEAVRNALIQISTAEHNLYKFR
jgi:non-canonical (house-cleaning) NTP pyrophosphatase